MLQYASVHYRLKKEIEKQQNLQQKPISKHNYVNNEQLRKGSEVSIYANKKEPAPSLKNKSASSSGKASGNKDESQSKKFQSDYYGTTASREKKPGSSQSNMTYSDATVIGGVEKRQGIPQYTPDNVKRSSDRPTTQSYQNKFFDEMKKSAFIEEKRPVLFVPFMMYWPTYDKMNTQQKNWYFYWRTQVRYGHYLRTDLSYIFVYVYELLSGVGWKKPQEGYDALLRVWSAYRNEYHELDKHLSNWTFDFALLHGLEYTAHLDGGTARIKPSLMADLLIEKQSKNVPLKLPFTLIEALCDYSIVNSKYYKGDRQEIMRDAIPRVVSLADVYQRKKTNEGILECFCRTGPRTEEHSIFQSAVCPDTDKKIRITARAYSTNIELREYFNKLARFCENTLREQEGYSGRLRGVEIEDKLATQIRSFLDREYSYYSSEPEEISRGTGVVLNKDSINTLRNESEAVRAALFVDETAVQEEDVLFPKKNENSVRYAARNNVPKERSRGTGVALDHDSINKLRNESDAVRATLFVDDAVQEEAVPLPIKREGVFKYSERNNVPKERSRGTGVVLNKDSINTLRNESDAVRVALNVDETVLPEEDALQINTSEISAMYSALSPDARSFIDNLLRSNGEIELQSNNDIMMDEINRKSKHYIGSTFLVKEKNLVLVEDDYREELSVFYESISQSSEIRPVSEFFNISVLPPELKAFIEQLYPEQQKALHTLLTSKNPNSELMLIAERSMTMPETLLDEINETAMQILGDLIVDSMNQEPCIMDEYAMQLTQSIVQEIT